MVLFVIVTAILFGFLLYIRQNLKPWKDTCTSTKRLDGKTVLITGGTSGIGLEMSKEFAKRGAKLIVACPFVEEGRNGEIIIKEESGNENVHFRVLDLGSFKSIREFVAGIYKTEDRLDILINNAGCGIPDFITEDGLNVLMQINYFGPVLLTILLLPLLKKTGKTSDPARIVNNASVLHSIGTMRYFNLNTGGHGMVNRYIIYGTSKLCLTLFTRHLTKLIDSNIVVTSADPGVVGTNIFYGLGYISGFMMKNFNHYFFNTARDGAQCAIYIVLHDNPNELKGKYLRSQYSVRPCKKATDDELAAKVWTDTVRLTKMTKEELEKGIGRI